jgi:hypothetical protein
LHSKKLEIYVKAISCIFLTAILTSITSVAIAGQDAAEQYNKLPWPSDLKHVKLGLWEDTIEKDNPSSPPGMDFAKKFDTSRLSPEDRARIEAMMKKKQQQIKDRGPTTTITKRNCVTQKTLDDGKKGLEGIGHDAPSCTVNVLDNSASKLSFKSDCDMKMENAPPEMKNGGRMSMTMTVEVKSPELVVMQTSSEANFGGTPMKRHETTTSRWIGAACGGVK